MASIMASERSLVSVLFIAISVAALLMQTSARVRGDAEQYQRMASLYAEGFSGVSALPPFVFRVATPWLAARADAIVTPIVPRWLDLAIDDASGLDGVLGFYAVNIAASFAVAMVLLSYLRVFVRTAWIRLALVAFWMLQWHTPPRYTYFMPVNVEPTFLLAVTLVLLAIEHVSSGNRSRQAYLIAIIVLIGTLIREAMALLAVVSALHYYRDWRKRRVGHLELIPATLPLVATAAALVATRFLAVPFLPSEPFAVPLEMLREKSPVSWFQAWFFVFGPISIGLMLATPALVPFLRQRPHLVLYLAGVSLLAFVGGTDTERVLGWAFPVVLVLLGISLDEHLRTLRRRPLVALMLLAGILISARIFWPIPGGEETHIAMTNLAFNGASLVALLDKVLVMQNYYANLWTYYGSGPIHAVLLAVEVSMTAAFVVYLKSGARRLDE